MSQKELTVASWNIAGGHRANSESQFDYDAREDADYFIEQLAKLNPDIVCLQESHMNESGSLSRRIAESLSLPYVFETANHPSHIDKTYDISTAILSKKPITDSRAEQLPYPTFKMQFKDGREAAIHNKYLQIVSIGDIYIANSHVNNIEMFGYDYAVGEGRDFAAELEQAFSYNLERPIIFACDLNFQNAEQIFNQLYESLYLKDGLPGGATRLEDTHTDYILYSPELTIVDSDIIKTDSDHFLCWAKFCFAF